MTCGAWRIVVLSCALVACNNGSRLGGGGRSSHAKDDGEQRPLEGNEGLPGYELASLEALTLDGATIRGAADAVRPHAAGKAEACVFAEKRADDGSWTTLAEQQTSVSVAANGAFALPADGVVAKAAGAARAILGFALGASCADRERVETDEKHGAAAALAGGAFSSIARARENFAPAGGTLYMTSLFGVGWRVVAAPDGENVSVPLFRPAKCDDGDAVQLREWTKAFNSGGKDVEAYRYGEATPDGAGWGGEKAAFCVLKAGRGDTVPLYVYTDTYEGSYLAVGEGHTVPDDGLGWTGKTLLGHVFAP